MNEKTEQAQPKRENISKNMTFDSHPPTQICRAVQEEDCDSIQPTHSGRPSPTSGFWRLELADIMRKIVHDGKTQRDSSGRKPDFRAHWKSP